MSELSTLNISDIDWQNRIVKVVGKGNKERVTFFSARAAIYMKKYISSRTDNCSALFVTIRRPFRRISNRGIQRDLANVSRRTSLIKNVSPHTLRHSFATLMLNNGCPMSVLRELLGHSDLSTTQRYAKVTHGYKQQCYEKYIHQ